IRTITCPPIAHNTEVPARDALTDRVFSLAVQNQPPRLPFYPLIVIGIIVLLAVVTALSGFFHRHPTHHVSAAPVKAARVTPRQVAMRAAQQFMTDFQTRNFQAQWARLSPSARQLWPSKSARDRMLAVKFSHIHPRVSLGQPASGATWFSRESAGHGIPHLWRIPVTVRFSRPATAASAYRHLALYIRVAAGRATIVGEGPASIDAPIIMPAHIQPRQVHVPILMYHRVGPFPQRSGWDSTYGYEIEYGLTVSPAEFRAQMAYLAGHGYRAISFPRLFDALLYGLPLPKKSVVLTFDDGRQSPYFYALPVLRRYGFNATFFICAGFAGQTNETPSHLNVQHYLSWRQMATLSRLGMWIEDHGVKDINPLYTLS